MVNPCSCFFFFFNDTATTEIYTLSLHAALPICLDAPGDPLRGQRVGVRQQGHELLPAKACNQVLLACAAQQRSEEHTSELQSRQYLVCRLLLEKKIRMRQSRPGPWPLERRG